ncbi:MAG: QueT transporter family protein [Clostridiales Family XIII bacterium]|nr:QueT transporter family protein [Clostridiales Family XIII bacterium]
MSDRSAAAAAASRTRFLLQAAVIGAAYAALTVALAPMGYGPVQIRFSEALAVLPCFTPAAIPGLFVGCLVSNLVSPYGLPDLICGSAASLLAACGTWLLRRRRLLAPLPPVIANALIIGAMLYYVYGIDASLWANALWVGCGQLVACYGLGYPLMRLLERHSGIFRLQ